MGFSRTQLLIITAIITTTLFTGVIIGYFLQNNTRTTQPINQQKLLSLSLKEAMQADENKTTSFSTKTFIVSKGETLSHIFKRAQLPESLLINISKIPLASSTFIRMQPGQSIQISINLKNQFHALTYEMSAEKSLRIEDINHKLSAKIINKPRTEALQFKSATIHHSLTEAAIHTGITPDLLTQIKTMFAGKVNFSRDIHSGDKIKVLYEEYYIDGTKDQPGHVVAAELDTHHKKLQVVRFKEHNISGYYTPNGHAISSLFLKFPIIYKRISSYFNFHRFDPILHRIHPHLGIDLAAPRGTPVKSIGNGKVLLRGWVRGYGNTVIIRYNKTYKTLYGHMEKFAKNLKSGSHVKKGQIVGYVGSTGWSTGPHLHFEVYKHGKPTNPLKLHFPHSPPIPEKYQAVFSHKAHYLLSEMQLFEQAKQSLKHG